MRRVLFSVPVALALTMLTILSIPSVPSEVAAWSNLLFWVDVPPWRYALPIAGWVFVLSVLAYLIYSRQKSRRATPEHSPEPASPLDRLRDALTRGISLRFRVMMEGADAHETPDGKLVGGEPPPVTRDDPLYRWAKETWEIIHRDFPEYADEFYGERGGTHGLFMLTFSKEVNRDGRTDYLEARVDLLRRIIERVSSASQG